MKVKYKRFWDITLESKFLRILEKLVKYRNGLTTAELHKELNIPKTTIYEHLEKLEKMNEVIYERVKNYNGPGRSHTIWKINYN